VAIDLLTNRFESQRELDSVNAIGLKESLVCASVANDSYCCEKDVPICEQYLFNVTKISDDLIHRHYVLSFF
jgi:hypothetical protein